MAVAAPVMQQVVLSAQTVVALVSAAAYVAKVHIDKWYQQPTVHKQPTQATPTYASTNNSNTTNSNAPQTAPKTYTFKHFAIHDLVAQAMQQQLGAPLSPEQKKVVHSVVANPFKAGIAPITQVRLNTSPYHDMHAGRIITGQDFVRWEYGNETQHLYGQISFNHHPHMRGPTPQELEEYRLLYRYEHNPEYRQQIDAQREYEIRILIQAAIDCATFGKIAALKTFFATTRLQAPFDYEIKQIRYWLAPLFFDHTTGELVAKPKSIVEALRPIVEYFKNQYGDQWHHELGKYLDMQQFHLLVDAADYKGWYWAVNKIYSWFYSTFYLQWLNLAKKVVGNTTNQKIMALIETCQMQDFEAAKAIAQDAQSSVADEIFAYFYNQKFDAYGIRREFANDPAWAQLSEQTKQEIKNLPNGITFYNNFLSLRAQEKTRQEIAEEQKNRPCGTGSIKEQEIQKPPCIVDQEIEPKGACIQGVQEIPDRPACEVTQEQEPKKGCNYGTQTQPSMRDPEVVQQEESTVDVAPGDSGSKKELDIDTILEGDTAGLAEHREEIEKIINVLIESGKLIPDDVRDQLIEIALEQEKKLKEENAPLPRTLERVIKEFELVKARLKIQHGKDIVDEAVSLFNTSEKGLVKNIKTLEKLEEIAEGLKKINGNPRWEKFKYDAAKGKIDANSIREAMAAIACEEQKLLPLLERANHEAEDFIEVISKRCWDVKTPHSYAINGREIFSVEEFVDLAIKDTLKNNAEEHIILNVSELSEKDYAELIKKLGHKLTKLELEKIVVVHVKNPSKSMYF
jgi:polyhydroxyalkanoate synthesis regulator phasin